MIVTVQMREACVCKSDTGYDHDAGLWSYHRRLRLGLVPLRGDGDVRRPLVRLRGAPRLAGRPRRGPRRLRRRLRRPGLAELRAVGLLRRVPAGDQRVEPAGHLPLHGGVRGRCRRGPRSRR